jgi:hypothetical protein
METQNNLKWTLSKIECEKSIFLKQKMKEYPNRSKILGFIDNNMGISFVGKNRYKNLVFSKIETEQDQMKQYLEKYMKTYECFSTSYRLSKHKWGRIIPNGYLSLSIFHRPTRHALSEGNYIDIDMVCAHPQIVCELCRLNGCSSSVTALNEYALNSKLYRQQLMTSHNVSYDTAKQLPIRLMFGGSYNTWLNDNNVENKKKHPLFVTVENEMLNIMEMVFANNQHIKNDVLKCEKMKWKNDQEAKRGVMGLWAQSIERLLQETAISYLVDVKGFILDDIVPSQDGFMIRPSLWYDDILNDCKYAVFMKTGINMDFLNKPFDEAIDIPELESKSIKEWEDFVKTKPLSNLLIELYGDYIVCDEKSKNLFIFYEGRWYDETTSNNQRYIIRYISENLYEHAKNRILLDKFISEKDLTRLLSNLRNNTSSSTKMFEIIKHTLSTCKLVNDIFDKKPFLLGFDNGVYDLTNNLFRIYNYDDYMTVTTGYNYKYIDIDNPSDEILNIKTNISNILDDIQPEHANVMLLLQILASGLDGIAYQKMFMYNGKGGNGKGLIGSLMCSILGSYYLQPNNGIIKEAEKANQASPDMLNLKNKRYINFKEVEGVLKASSVRNLTGGGKFSGRMLYGNPIEFKMNSTYVMEFNNAPDLDGKPQESDYRRIVNIQFPTNFTENEDKIGKNIGGCEYKKANSYYVTDEFLEESKMVFMHMLIKVYTSCEKDNSGGMKFVIPKDIIERTELYLANQNVFKVIFDKNWEVCEIIKNSKGKIDKSDLKLKTFTVKTLWSQVQTDEQYKQLSSRDKRNMYGREAFYMFLNENYKIDTDKNKSKIIIGLQNVTEEEYADEEVEEVENEVKEFENEVEEVEEFEEENTDYEEEYSD